MRAAIALVAVAYVLVIVPRSALARRSDISGKSARSRQVVSLSPSSGNPMGGTQVTVSLGDDIDVSSLHPYSIRCQFGEKVIPAQSVFVAPESQGQTPAPIKVLCTAPAGAARSSVAFRISLGGNRYLNGPKFTFRVEHPTASSS